jgi:hypothetical protein
VVVSLDALHGLRKAFWRRPRTCYARLVTGKIWLSAHVLVRSFGECAAFEAGSHADECLANGDMDGARMWRMVIRAVEEMQREAEEGERVN